MLINKLRRRTLFGRKKKHSDGGFTLIELLVVVTVLGILAAVVVFAVSGIGDKGHATASTTDLRILQTAEEAACAYAPPPNTPIGPNSPPSDFEDTPQLLRDGFLASIGQYNDVAFNPLTPASTCTGAGPNTGINTSYATWTPGPSYASGPVTITDCTGNQTTFTTPPKKVLANDLAGYKTMFDMGLANITYIPANLAQYLNTEMTPAQLAVAAPALATNTLPAYNTGGYIAPSAQLGPLVSRE